MTNTRHYMGHRKRLRERLAHDPRQLADYEILEMLLGYVLVRQDTKPLAKALLDEFGSLPGVFAAHPSDLRRIKGFGPKLESFWSLWKETWARMSELPLKSRPQLNTPDAVASMAIARLGTCTREECWVALLDKANGLLSWDRLTQGTVDQTPIYVREVLSRALEHGASSIILVHNHPSGDTHPSRQDEEVTARVCRSARDMGMRVLDHLVVSGNSFFSFQSHGLL
ncbi:DNA repair protein RadC [Desulfobaculum bizertense]|uniref:JAB domain-containing protein n=1 Tax=Desulfobaculum bizertense TaxID=376490 RepID=UPI001F1B1E09|nr:DNA repair protein RadC [Desulfobaculum bizertense]UIJ37639.1 DNA repair protein RadC [Desulfobaculum bizertense]